MAELFTPASNQLTRLEEEIYEQVSQVSLARIIEVEELFDLPDPDDTESVNNAIAEQRLVLERELQSATEDLIEGESVAAWEEKLAESVTSALLLALLLGFGRSEPIRQQPEARTVIGMTVDLIKGQMRAIMRNADNIVGGITLGKLRDIPRRRSLSFRSGYENQSNCQCDVESVSQ